MSTVNVLSPGITDTDLPEEYRSYGASLSPFHRVGTLQEVADVSAFLASGALRGSPEKISKPAAAWCEPGRNNSITHNQQERAVTMKFSLVPLLIAGQTISAKVRQSLLENRLKDAATLLMQEYGLTCAEAGDLLNVTQCE